MAHPAAGGRATQRGSDAIYLIAMRDAAIVRAPRGLLRAPEELCPRDVMVEADLSASGAADVLLSHVSASAIEAVCLLMIDSRDLETLMVVDPRRRFVGVDDRTLGKRARMNEAAWLSILILPGPICRALPDHHNNPALAILVPGKTTPATGFFLVGWGTCRRNGCRRLPPRKRSRRGFDRKKMKLPARSVGITRTTNLPG